MKKIALFIISVFAMSFLSKGQDTIVNPSPYLLYSSCTSPDSVVFANTTAYRIGALVQGAAIENYGDGRIIYGIAVTAKFPLPDNSMLTYYERRKDTIMLADSIVGKTIPYPIDYWFKQYPISIDDDIYYDTCVDTLLPCFLYLFDSPHQNVDTFYVGLKAPLSTWYDSTQLYIYGTIIIRWFYEGDGQTYVWMEPVDPFPQYYRYVSSDGGVLYPLVGLPCTAPQMPTVAEEGDSLRMAWADVGEYYQLSFKNTDRATTMVTDTLADTLATFANSLFESGNYEVRLRKACRYTTSTYDTLVWSEWSSPAGFAFSPAAGITPVESSQSLSFSLLPNPARGSVTIVVDEESGVGNEELLLAVLDLSGRETTTITHLSGTTFTLDLGTLSAGTYLVRLTTPTATATRRLVVQ